MCLYFLSKIPISASAESLGYVTGGSGEGDLLSRILLWIGNSCIVAIF